MLPKHNFYHWIISIKNVRQGRLELPESQWHMIYSHIRYQLRFTTSNYWADSRIRTYEQRICSPLLLATQAYLLFAGAVGFEPTTNGFGDQSTTFAYTYFFFWTVVCRQKLLTALYNYVHWRLGFPSEIRTHTCIGLKPITSTNWATGKSAVS